MSEVGCTAERPAGPHHHGLFLERTVDDPAALAGAPLHRARARSELARWRAGDRRPNDADRRS